MLTPEQIKKIKRIKNPITRQRFIKFYQLPKDLQEATFSPEIAEKIRKIAQREYNLSEEKLSRVAYGIGLVVIGELPINQLISYFQEEFKVSEMFARNLTIALYQRVLAPFKESLKKVHNIKEMPPAFRILETVRQQKENITEESHKETEKPRESSLPESTPKETNVAARNDITNQPVPPDNLPLEPSTAPEPPTRPTPPSVQAHPAPPEPPLPSSVRANVRASSDATSATTSPVPKKQDPYREPVSRTPSEAKPKLKGNIVDLKNDN